MQEWWIKLTHCSFILLFFLILKLIQSKYFSSYKNWWAKDVNHIINVKISEVDNNSDL